MYISIRVVIFIDTPEYFQYKWRDDCIGMDFPCVCVWLYEFVLFEWMLTRNLWQHIYSLYMYYMLYDYNMRRIHICGVQHIIFFNVNVAYPHSLLYLYIYYVSLLNNFSEVTLSKGNLSYNYGKYI